MENIKKGDYVKGVDCVPYRVCIVNDVNNSVITYVHLNGTSGKALRANLRLATEKEIKTEWI